MGYNVQLMKEIVARIRAIPDAHNQQFWGGWDVKSETELMEKAEKIEADGGDAYVMCGSAGCVAGTACMLSGDLFAMYDTDVNDDAYDRALGVFVVNEVYIPADKEIRPINARAAYLLRVTYEEQEVLFHPETRQAGVLEMLDLMIRNEELAGTGQMLRMLWDIARKHETIAMARIEAEAAENGE